MTSIMRARVEPAFHIAWTSPRGLNDVAAGAEHDLLVVRSEADLALQ